MTQLSYLQGSDELEFSALARCGYVLLYFANQVHWERDGWDSFGKAKILEKWRLVENYFGCVGCWEECEGRVTCVAAIWNKGPVKMGDEKRLAPWSCKLLWSGVVRPTGSHLWSSLKQESVELEWISLVKRISCCWIRQKCRLKEFV